MIVITDKAKCCGCTACKETCPTDAIKMKSDQEGFVYPVTDTNKCIKCNKCNRICPIINDSKETDYPRKAYIAQNKKDDIRFDSTSGGVFSALANYVISRKGYVYGAEFDREWNVVHGVGINKEDLSRFRGSKYIQSDLNDTFQSIKKLLEDDNWVLFTGTPCQVAGLHYFLQKKYDKLILMDVVCYSISSPKVWKLYLEHLVKKNKLDISRVSRIKFRDKSKYGYEYTLMTFYDKDKKVLYSSGPESNQMLRSFVSNTSTRPSCYECKFKKINRLSDFTVWDCYNVYKYKKELDDNGGTSHVIIHSDKASKILEEIKEDLLLQLVDLNQAVASEPALLECSVPNDKRDIFFEYIEEGINPFNVFFKDNLKVKIERLLRRILSRIGIYGGIKRLIKG